MKHPINNFFNGEIKITASDQHGNEINVSNSKKGYDQLSMEDMKNVIWKLKDGFRGMKDSYNGAKQYRVDNRRYTEEIRKIKEQFLERDVEKNIFKRDYRFEYYFDVPPVCKYYKTFIKALKKAEKIPFSEITDSYAETPVWRYEKTELEKELMKKFPDAYSITVKEMHNDYNLKPLFEKKALKVSEAWEIQAIVVGSKTFVKEKGKINMQLSLTQLEENIGNIIEKLKKINDEN